MLPKGDDQADSNATNVSHNSSAAPIGSESPNGTHSESAPEHISTESTTEEEEESTSDAPAESSTGAVVEDLEAFRAKKIEEEKARKDAAKEARRQKDEDSGSRRSLRTPCSQSTQAVAPLDC